MADPSSMPVTPGAGAFVATYEITEESEQRLIQRMALNDAEGTDVTVGSAATITTSVTRPLDTTTYAANDAMSNSTSSPAVISFASAARVSGGSGIVTDLLLTSSIDPALLLDCELWLFDSAPTALNDNAAFALSDTDVLKLVGVVPLTLATTTAGSGTSSFAHAQNLNIGFTCVGGTTLYGLLKAKNAYVPASGEVLTLRAKVVRTS
jgi:hypothetical protein